MATVTPLVMRSLPQPAAKAAPSPVERLLSLPDDRFATVVGRDIRRRTATDLGSALRDPQVWERWEAELLRTLARLNAQLSLHVPSSHAEDCDWAVNAKRSRHHVKQRLAEVRGLRMAAEVVGGG